MADALSTVLDPNNQQMVTFRQQAPQLLETAQALVITDDAGLMDAAEITKTTTAAVKGVKALFLPAKRSLTDAKRQIDGLEASLLSGFEQADAILRGKVTAYHVERRKLAQAEQQRQLAEEKKRREDEQLAQALRLAELAKTTGEEHYARAAEVVINQPVRTPTVAVEMPKVKGMSFREETGVQVFDLFALVQAVAAGKVSIEALQANEKWLRGEAVQRGTTVKDGDALVPGVLVTKKPDVTVRSR
jgi:hypothetical protein